MSQSHVARRKSHVCEHRLIRPNLHHIGPNLHHIGLHLYHVVLNLYHIVPNLCHMLGSECCGSCEMKKFILEILVLLDALVLTIKNNKIHTPDFFTFRCQHSITS